MIFLRPPAIPKGFAKRKAIVSATKRVAALIKKGQAPASADFTAVWGDHKKAFLDAQQRKCVFCETRFVGGYAGDIEHYRPKTEVKSLIGPAGRGNRDDTSGAPRAQTFHPVVRPGYWWLAYAWSNWTFSCSKCNGWKLNQFPLLAGIQVALARGAEKNEQPGLINPFLVDPDGHFDVARNSCAGSPTTGSRRNNPTTRPPSARLYESSSTRAAPTRSIRPWLATW